MKKDMKILIVGSSNTDMVIQTHHLPRPGETVIGGTFLMNPGGKGANQAVAVARLGQQVFFVCKTGNDIFGRQARKLMELEGIDLSYAFTDSENPSGVALITVDAKAENCIVVAPGSNACLMPADVAQVETVIDKSDIVLMQLEIPIETVEYIAHKASEKGKRVLLNPAPMQSLTPDLLASLYLLTPNETEAEMITGIHIEDNASAIRAAEAIVKMGVKSVVITLGSRGALVYADGESTIVPSVSVKAVDTTAAGDVFNGAVAVSLAEGKSLKDAVCFACKAAAISVTRMGAQASVPYRKEVDLFINN